MVTLFVKDDEDNHIYSFMTDIIPVVGDSVIYDGRVYVVIGRALNLDVSPQPLTSWVVYVAE